MNLMEKIRKTVRDELRAAGLLAEPAQPLPTDLDAEGEVLSAVIGGEILCSDLRPLSAQHFYSTLHQAIWRAAEDVAPGDLEGIYTHLTAAGWIGAIDDELEVLALTQPSRSKPMLRTQADRIIELSRRRDLIRRLQRLEADLRTDRVTEPEAKEALREVVE